MDVPHGPGCIDVGVQGIVKSGSGVVVPKRFPRSGTSPSNRVVNEWPRIELKPERLVLSSGVAMDKANGGVVCKSR